MSDNIKHKLAKPEELLADLVYCFSYIKDLNLLHEGIIIPNGRVDLSFYKTPNKNVVSHFEAWKHIQSQLR